MLMDQIIQAKQGSQADMLSLLQQFQPILKKYGRKLWGEDGLEDMTAAFLQVIHDMKPEQIRCRAEGAVVQYLVQSVRHAYERLPEADGKRNLCFGTGLLLGIHCGGAGPRDGDQQAKRQSDQAAGPGKTPAAVGNREINKQPLPGEAACFPMESVRGLE